MNPSQLLEHFDRISEAPDAVARLRRFILDLAVRGKLVEQNPDDEPAAELLKRIQVEKVRLVKEGKAGKQDPFEAPLEEVTPFQIPKTWLWVPATYPAYLVSDMGKKVQTKDVLGAGGFPVVDQGKVFIRGYSNDSEKVIHIESPIVLFGDHTRETKLIDFNFIVGADGVKLLQPVCLLATFYYLALTWLPLDSRGYGRHYKLLRAAVIPLPPLAEQHRIVAKVDELMALCEQLEAAKNEREARRDRLVAASLNRIGTAPAATDEATAEAQRATPLRDAARFHLDHLPRLTTRPEHIKQLRQTILNLAVRGRLVPQDPNDESAAVLLKRIEAERVRLVKEGKIRKQQQLPSLESVEIPFEVPEGWEWLRLGNIGFTQTGTTPSSNTPEYFGDYIPFVKPANLTGKKIDYSGAGISEEGIHHSRLIPKNSALMVCIGSTIGKVNVTDRDVCCNQQINTVTPFLDLEYLTAFTALALKATYFQKLVMANAGLGTLPIISKGKWEVLPLPLPPLSEQHRIVAKVDELMALCDQLEAQLSATQTGSRRLLEAVLYEALAALGNPTCRSSRTPREL